MKKNYSKVRLLFLSWSTLTFSIFAGPTDDLVTRLGYYSTSSCKNNIEHLKSTFNESYNLDKDWEKTINSLDKQKEILIKGLKNGDQKAIKESQILLDKLDKIMLQNPFVKTKEIVIVKRDLGKNARKAMGGSIGVGPSNFQNNSELWNPKSGWNNQFVKISLNNNLSEQMLYQPPQGVIISDPEPNEDGTRLMYSSIGTNDRWHLFELNTKTGESKQLTPEEYKDFDSFDGCYTSDGKYIFCSTGTFLGLPCTDGGNKMCGLFVYDPKTEKTRQLTFDQDSNWGPTMLNNGQIMYQRWEYADLAHSNSRMIFSMNPDGTSQNMYYGTNSYFPTALFGTRAIPGHPSAFVGVATGHHSIARSGRLMIFDPLKGREEATGVVQEIPYSNRIVEPLVRDRYPDGIFPHFLYPYPLNSNYFLVTMKPSNNALWGLYLVDTFDNVTLIAEEENYAYIEPVVLETTKPKPIIPDRVNLEDSTSTVFIQDIYQGPGLQGIPKGTVKKIRIGSYNFSPIGQGGLLGTIGIDGPWDIKKIVGVVDVEEDGSAMFKIPANTPIFIQPLDEEGKALQIMRSWFTGMPGETVSCIGCHESKNEIARSKVNIASRKQSQPITPWLGNPRGFSFRHEVQPILDSKCISCHDGSNKNIPYFKGDSLITDWSSQISGATNRNSGGGNFSESYYQLQRYVRRPGIESDLHMLAPMDVHADQTELMQILNKGHHGVELNKEEVERFACWIDFNAPYHGRRSDISSFKHAEKSNNLRKSYASMFGIDHTADSEWLPEIPQKVKTIEPATKFPNEGIDSIEGWPYYDGTKFSYNRAHTAANIQLALGETQRSIRINDDITLELIHVPAGEFIMGSTNHTDEMPRSAVRIEKSYWIGRFEITNKQFKAFNPNHKSRDEHRHGYQFGRKGYNMDHPDQPAVRLAWTEAMEFCKWLSKLTGYNFTLPTEAQWEWACRAGSSTPFWYGGMEADFSRYANLGDIRLRDFAACTAYKDYESWRIIDNPNRYDDWIPRDNKYDDGGFVSEQIGKYRPNAWDISDMHGNVSEWTLSEYRPYPYDDADGRNASTGESTKRVVRGGSWYDRPHKATSSYRLSYRDYQKVFNVGFRVVLND